MSARRSLTFALRLYGLTTRAVRDSRKRGGLRPIVKRLNGNAMPPYNQEHTEEELAGAGR